MQKIKQALSGHSDDTTTSSTGSQPHSTPTTGSHPHVGANGSSNGQLPVQAGVHGRAEETGPADRVKGETPGFTDPHSHGHDRSLANKFDPKAALQDETVLGHKEHEHHHLHRTEEVTRQKEHERHVHHVQHHVQPVHDTQHHETTHTEKAHPVTHIKENHGATKENIASFEGLGAGIKHEQHDHGVANHRIVDKGEQVHETVKHHIHNVVQPVLKTDHHHHETIHTTIPSHHVTHEAPIVHDSVHHAPVSKEAFHSAGGALDSKLTHSQAGAQHLQEGGCDRTVDGVGERLAKDLGLKSGTVSHEHRNDTRI